MSGYQDYGKSCLSFWIWYEKLDVIDIMEDSKRLWGNHILTAGEKLRTV